MKSMAPQGLLTPTGGGYGLGPSLLRLGSLGLLLAIAAGVIIPLVLHRLRTRRAARV